MKLSNIKSVSSHLTFRSTMYFSTCFGTYCSDKTIHIVSKLETQTPCKILSPFFRDILYTFLGHHAELIKIHYPGTPVCSITLARSTSALHTSYCHFLVPIRPHRTLPVLTPIRMFRPFLQSRIFLHHFHAI